MSSQSLTDIASRLGFVTGTGIPAVIGSRVPWVRVRFWYLAHRDIPCTRTTVSRVCTGILKQSEHNFYCFETCFFSYLIKFFFILSHRDATKYGSASRAYIFASYHQALPSHSHSHSTSKCKSLFYILKTNQ